MSVDTFTDGLLEVFKPQEDGTPVDWMEANLKSLKGNVGHFDCSQTPWLRDVFLATFDPETRTVVNLGAVQTGKSVYLGACVSYIVARQPTEVLLYQDTNANAKDFHNNTLRPMWTGCPPVKAMMPSDKQVRWSCIRLDRSTVWTLGADAESNLQRYSTKWVFCDEAWRYKRGAMGQAKARTLSFGWLGKFIACGQGGMEGADFHALWLSSTQEVWSWACPSCGEVQPFEWESVKLPDGALTDMGINADAIERGTQMECRGCKCRLPDTDGSRHAMNSGGRYVQLNANASRSNRGFHWNALAARPWGELAKEWAQAKLAQTNGDDTPMVIWIQKQMARFYSFDNINSTDEVSPGAYKLREEWEDEGGFDLSMRSPVDKWEEGKENLVRLRFAGVDCQRDGFFIVIRAWATDGRSRLVDWAYFHTIDEVDAFRLRHGVIPPFVFIDAGDQQDFAHRTAARLGWNCTRGTSKTAFPWPERLVDGTVKSKSRPYSKPREIEPAKGIITRQYYFGNLPFKDLLWRLRRTGTHSFPLDAGDDYKAQMASERRTKTAAGIPIWKAPKGRANHLWDCEVLLMLPALVFGLAGELKQTKGEVEEPEPQADEATEDAEGEG
jgi:phage terminase large subunit GpA-like protein